MHERSGRAPSPLDGDRSLLAKNVKSYLTDQALKDLSSGRRPIGKPLRSTEVVKRDRGGLTLWRYDVKFAKKKIQVWVRNMPDGRIEEYQVYSMERTWRTAGRYPP